MKVTDLIALIQGMGFERVGSSPQGLSFRRVYPNGRWSGLSFAVYLSAREEKARDGSEICKLIGPVLDTKTRQCDPNAVLGSWRTVRGAIEGLEKKCHKADEDFRRRELLCFGSYK